MRYAITNLTGPGTAPPPPTWQALWTQLEQDFHSWAQEGIDYVQLREKSLNASDLFHLARMTMALLHALQDPRPRLLVNGRPDIAAAAAADGVHLTAKPGELHPQQVRSLFNKAGRSCCIVSVSCHTEQEVATAGGNGADLILFGPVFEKSVAGSRLLPGLGLARLEQACVAAGCTPVLALGGVDASNSQACLQAGAAGVAAIRLFAPLNVRK